MRASKRVIEEFRRTAIYRGVPFAHLGMRVEVGSYKGIIVGSNGSANFDVLFEDGPRKGLRLNCHPHWMMKYFDQGGKLIHDTSRPAVSAAREVA